MSPFPDEILEEILSRLPVKCLLRLRCVSKSWFALISTSYFVKLHLNRSAKTKINLSLFLTSFRIHRVDFDSLDDGVIQPAMIDYPPLNMNIVFLLWGSCDGLICISLRDTVILLNPSTRKYLTLPYESFQIPNLGSFHHEIQYGIAYTCNDYKVVRITDVMSPGGDILDYEIMVYSLSSNSWHRSEKIPRYRNVRRSGDVVVGGALHWIFSLESERQEESRIVAFDLGTEKYRLIPEPEYLDPHFRTGLHLFEGCLSLCCHYENSMTVDIWLLKEYGGRNESWSRLITMLPISHIDMFVEPIAYSKSGKKVLLAADCVNFFWYNLEQKSVEEDIILHGMKERHAFFMGYTCLESLVLLDVTAAAANTQNPQEDANNWQLESDLGAHEDIRG